jgi:rhamnogalacturonyl hydrolase YesR
MLIRGGWVELRTFSDVKVIHSIEVGRFCFDRAERHSSFDPSAGNRNLSHPVQQPTGNQMHRPSKSHFGSLFQSLLVTVCLASPLRAADPTPDSIIKDMKRVADWQIENPSKHPIHDWTQAPFFLGLSNLNQVTGDAKYLEALDGFGKKISYGPGPRVTHADDHAVLQAWLEEYRLDKDPAKLNPSIAHFDKVIGALAGQTPKSVSGGTFTWCWCDALFMSPAVWVQLSQLTGDPKYLEWADQEWWTTTDVLYNPTHHLYYRDNNFFTKKTPSGKSVFWARGNGWVIGGLVHVLDHLPADHPSREKYLGLYHDMMYALLKLQNPDGLWRTSLLDPDGPQGESSGSAFFVYGMAWGINRGLLPADLFRPDERLSGTGQKHPADGHDGLCPENRRRPRQAGHQGGIDRSLWFRSIPAGRVRDRSLAGPIQTKSRCRQVRRGAASGAFHAIRATRVRPIRPRAGR